MDSAGTSVSGELCPRIDPEILGSLVRLGQKRGRDLLGQLLEIFERQTPEGIAALRRALERGDARALGETAHSLKGSYQSLGAPRMAELALELEQRGRAGELQGCGSLLEGLEREFEATAAELRSFPRA